MLGRDTRASDRTRYRGFRPAAMGSRTNRKSEVPMLKLDNNALLREAAYIDGEWRGARSGARFAVKNPATGEVIAEVADLDETDAKDAIEAGGRAWGPWRAKTAKERAGPR